MQTIQTEAGSDDKANGRRFSTYCSNLITFYDNPLTKKRFLRETALEEVESYSNSSHVEEQVDSVEEDIVEEEQVKSAKEDIVDDSDKGNSNNNIY